jgi:hypothetical protein
MVARSDERDQLALIRPKYYAAENALPATGFTSDYLLAAAKKLRVRILCPTAGRNWCIDADEFDAALKRESDAEAREARSLSPEPIDEAEELRRELGLGLVKR